MYSVKRVHVCRRPWIFTVTTTENSKVLLSADIFKLIKCIEMQRNEHPGLRLRRF